MHPTVQHGRQTSDLFCGFQNPASEKLRRLTIRAVKQGRPGRKDCIPRSAFIPRFLRRCRSCGPHKARRELAYEDIRRSTYLHEITNPSTGALKKESVTTNVKPKPKSKRKSTAQPRPKPKSKPKPKPKPKGDKNYSSPSKKPKEEETGSAKVQEEAELVQRLLAALQQTTKQQNNQKKPLKCKGGQGENSENTRKRGRVKRESGEHMS